MFYPGQSVDHDRFPLETGDEVTVRVEEDKRRVVIEKTELSIPAQVAGDSRFPFGTGEVVKVTIDEENRRVIVEKIE